MRPSTHYLYRLGKYSRDFHATQYPVGTTHYPVPSTYVGWEEEGTVLSDPLGTTQYLYWRGTTQYLYRGQKRRGQF